MSELEPESVPGSSQLAQLQRIAILASTDRDSRLERVRAIVRRPVGSTKELSFIEAQTVIRELERQR